MKSLTKLIQSPWVLWLFKVVRDSAVSYMAASSFAPTKAWGIGLGIAVGSGILHAGEAYLTSLSNQQQAPPVSGQGAKVPMILLGLMLLAGTASAQVTETQGFDIVPHFVGPAQFVQTSNGGWELLPNAGLAVAGQWQDIQTVVSNGVTVKSLQWAAGLCFEENFGENSNANTVNNAVLGITGDWKGYAAVLGLQIMGPALGGPGSSGLVFGASYPF